MEKVDGAMICGSIVNGYMIEGNIMYMFFHGTSSKDDGIYVDYYDYKSRAENSTVKKLTPENFTSFEEIAKQSNLAANVAKNTIVTTLLFGGFAGAVAGGLTTLNNTESATSHYCKVKDANGKESEFIICGENNFNKFKIFFSHCKKPVANAPQFQPTQMPVAQISSARVNVTAENCEQILVRANMFMEDEEWEKADAYFESLLDFDPTCAKYYFGKAMVEFRVSDLLLLGSKSSDFLKSKNIQKALNFSNGNELPELKRLIDSETRVAENKVKAALNDANVAYNKIEYDGNKEFCVKEENLAYIEDIKKAYDEGKQSLSGIKNEDLRQEYSRSLNEYWYFCQNNQGKIKELEQKLNCQKVANSGMTTVEQIRQYILENSFVCTTDNQFAPFTNQLFDAISLLVPGESVLVAFACTSTSFLRKDAGSSNYKLVDSKFEYDKSVVFFTNKRRIIIAGLTVAFFAKPVHTYMELPVEYSFGNPFGTEGFYIYFGTVDAIKFTGNQMRAGKMGLMPKVRTEVENLKSFYSSMIIPAAPQLPAIEQKNTDALYKFKELLDAGILTQEEYDAKKREILGQ